MALLYNPELITHVKILEKDTIYWTDEKVKYRAPRYAKQIFSNKKIKQGGFYDEYHNAIFSDSIDKLIENHTYDFSELLPYDKHGNVIKNLDLKDMHKSTNIDKYGKYNDEVFLFYKPLIKLYVGKQHIKTLFFNTIEEVYNYKEIYLPKVNTK